MKGRLLGWRAVASLRHHSVAKYGLANLTPRVVAIASALTLTPIVLDRLGASAFGLWVLATQVPTLVVSPDLGLGNGALNGLSREYRKEGSLRSQLRRLVGLERMLAIVAASWFLLGSCAAGIYVEVSGTEPKGEFFLALCAGLACFVAGIPATVWGRAQLAQERAYIAARWEGAGRIVAFAASGVVIAVRPNLVLLVIAYLLPPTLALYANRLAYRRREFEAHAVDYPNIVEAFRENRGAVRLGKYFVVLQASYLVGIAVDPYLVNWILGPQDVTYFSIARRPYDALPLAVSLFSIALWPVFARIHEAGEVAKLRRAVFSIAGAGVAAVALGGSLIFALRGPIYSWLGRGVVVPTTPDLVMITINVSAVAVMLIVSNYLNAVSAIRIQAAIWTAGTLVLLAAKVVALHIGDIHGFILVASAGYVLLLVTPLCVLALHRLRRGGAVVPWGAPS